MHSSARTSARSAARINAETRMVQRREREYNHQVKWNNQVRYYKSCEKLANKFDDWTSPRYYETSNKKINDDKKKRQHQETLEKRQEKLKKLLDEDDRSFQIELMVRNRQSYLKKPEVPVEVLKEINSDLKLQEEERRKHEAELALYHQWRNNNPIVRYHERKRTLKDLKLSWLDQQIEKRLERERAEEECRKQVEEKKKWIEEEKKKQAELLKQVAEKKEKLQHDLSKQIEELQIRETESARLLEEEEEEAKKLFELNQLENERLEIERKSKQREIALENLKMHKLRLKRNAENVRENIESEKVLVNRLLELEIADKIEDERKKNEVKMALKEFLGYARDQQDLEKKRQEHFDFVFDSEAKVVYEKQREVWVEEQKARQTLLRDVLDTVKDQINDKIRKNKDIQRRVLEERQNTLKMLEEYDTDMRKTEEEEARRKEQWKKEIELQVKEKKVKEAELKNKYLKQNDYELEMARKEEERLRREIVDLQRRQGPVRHARSRILF
ncbi:hypothetical protein RN001_011034 [Aquatica leii]|uniref:Trichoplein keratin filament-binding protein n=1 Tax=Aquatica leii TaxID=1421715 RepID=A0AAN7P8M7_9COLE|nr:hypothetical protein RN001_011034 [Aquatica leii]